MHMALNIASNLVAFILVLGVLIFAHEFGHFFFAKLFGVRVYVFSFGFGKRLFGFARGGTDYRVSLIPLGGYVRMAGEAPEDPHEGTPDEFTSRPKWQRFLILFAGPGANVVIAIAFLAFLFMSGTEEWRDTRAIVGSVVPDKPAARAGLQMGDQIVEANGERVDSWDDFRLAISIHAASPVELKYIRNGKVGTTTLVPERVVTDMGVTGKAYLTQYMTTEIGRVLPDTAASRAGLRPGDIVTAANGTAVRHQDELLKILDANSKKTIPLDVVRGGQNLSLQLPPMQSTKEYYPGYVPPTRVKKLGFGAAIEESLEQNWKMVKYTFVVIGRLFRAEGSVKDFSGPISIARISGEMLRTGWKEVVSLMAVISLNLGIMNLLPIPVLDGGHIFVLLVEGVVRRDFSINVKERIQQVGFVMLAMLMIVVLYNDVIQNVMLLKRE